MQEDHRSKRRVLTEVLLTKIKPKDQTVRYLGRGGSRAERPSSPVRQDHVHRHGPARQGRSADTPGAGPLCQRQGARRGGYARARWSHRVRRGRIADTGRSARCGEGGYPSAQTRPRSESSGRGEARYEVARRAATLETAVEGWLREVVLGSNYAPKRRGEPRDPAHAPLKASGPGVAADMRRKIVTFKLKSGKRLGDVPMTEVTAELLMQAINSDKRYGGTTREGRSGRGRRAAGPRETMPRLGDPHRGVRHQGQPPA